MHPRSTDGLPAATFLALQQSLTRWRAALATAGPAAHWQAYSGKTARIRPTRSTLGLVHGRDIVFGSCNMGKRADLLKRVAADVFGGTGEVKAPKFVTVPLTRFLVSFRREPREADPSKDFASRAAIVPDVNNSDHFGSSNNPAPSPSELSSLGD